MENKDNIEKEIDSIKRYIIKLNDQINQDSKLTNKL